MSLAVSFGQGLQMTNILKDFWEDRQRGVCWLPRDVFLQAGVDLSAGQSLAQESFINPLRDLIVVAKNHLANALKYTLLIPKNEMGIRRFTLWAIALAVLTLKNIYRNPTFHSGAAVKVSRSTVKTTILVSNFLGGNNTSLNYLFRFLTRELI